MRVRAATGRYAEHEADICAWQDRGDAAARNRAAVAYMPFVRAFVHRTFKGQSHEADLVQYGAIGLLRAIDTWDRTRSLFTSWMVFWVRAEVYVAARGFTNAVRVNGRAWQKGVRVSVKHLDEPRPTAGDGVGTTTLLDSLMMSGYLVEEPRSEHDLIHAEDVSRLLEALTDLPARERKILDWRFTHAETLAEVGERFGISRERVRQLELRALDRLRQALEAA